jgi:integrase
MSRRFKPAVKSALPHKSALRFHDLRHTAASLAIRSGATPQQVQDRLGHKDARSTAIYSHLYHGHDEAFLAALDQAHSPTPAASNVIPIKAA